MHIGNMCELSKYQHDYRNFYYNHSAYQMRTTPRSFSIKSSTCLPPKFQYTTQSQENPKNWWGLRQFNRWQDAEVGFKWTWLLRFLMILCILQVLAISSRPLRPTIDATPASSCFVRPQFALGPMAISSSLSHLLFVLWQRIDLRHRRGPSDQST